MGMGWDTARRLLSLVCLVEDKPLRLLRKIDPLDVELAESSIAADHLATARGLMCLLGQVCIAPRHKSLSQRTHRLLLTLPKLKLVQVEGGATGEVKLPRRAGLAGLNPAL